MSSRNGQPVRIGQVVGLFGLKGAVKVLVLTDFTSRFAVGRELDSELGSRKILSVHWHKGQARVLLEGVDTPEKAQSLVWTYLTMSESDQEVLEEGEYLVSSLVGMNVIEGGEMIGKIDDVIKSPAHELLSVSGVLIPFIKQFVKKIDFESRTISVELIDGMRPGDNI